MNLFLSFFLSTFGKRIKQQYNSRRLTNITVPLNQPTTHGLPQINPGPARLSMTVQVTKNGHKLVQLDQDNNSTEVTYGLS